MTTILLGLLVFAASVSIDFSHARYVRALVEDRRLAAATWSLLQWTGATVGFYMVITTSLWFLPCEGLGLFVGTLLGSRKRATLTEG